MMTALAVGNGALIMVSNAVIDYAELHAAGRQNKEAGRSDHTATLGPSERAADTAEKHGV